MNMNDNPADLLTKVLPININQWEFIRMLQHHIFESFQRQLHLHSVGTLVGIKRSMMITYT